MTEPPREDRRPPGGHRRLGRDRAPQAGMTLVEMMIAMMIAAVVFAGGAAALISATKGLDFARQNRQAADLFTETIERARATAFANVAVVRDPAALAADPRVTSSGGSYWVDPDGPGPAASERLVVSTLGAVRVRQEVVRDSTRYALSSYVTQPAGTTAGHRRLVTWVTWRRGDRTHSRYAATSIAEGRAQSSAPALSMGTDSSFTVNAGATLALPASLMNTGSSETWDLSMSVPGRAWTVVWYVDADGNGARDAGEDTVLGDTSGDGRPDTGPMVTGQSLRLVGIVNVAGGEPAGTTTATITAAAVTSPGITGVVRHAVAVVAQDCAGCTYRSSFAANAAGPPADSTLRPRMPLVDAAGPSALLPNYDTDRDAVPGRTLAIGATTVTDPDPARSAVWQRQLANSMTLRGDVVVRLYVGLKALDALKAGRLQAEIGHTAADGTGWTAVGSVTTPPLGFTSGFSSLELRIAVPEVTIAKNRLLQLRLISPSASGPLWLAYGTAQYPASIDLPVVA